MTARFVSSPRATSRSSALAGRMVLAASAAILLHSGLHAQQHGSFPRLSAGISSRSSAAVATDDGFVAVGATYKAFFRRDGFEFMPVLGAAAPRNLPVRLTTREVRRAGAAESVPLAAAAKPVLRDGQVSYDRGSGITERYIVRDDGVELCFDFAMPLPGEGDLVVTMNVDSAFEIADRRGEDWVWSSPGLGGVRVAGVHGIDAAGLARTGSSRLEGSSFELRLPAPFVDQAAFPLTLDPLFSGFAVTAGANDTECAGAYDLSYDRYLLVWRRIVSGLDSDIVAQRIDAAMQPVGNLILLETTAQVIAAAPTVCNINTGDRFIVVWQQTASPYVFGPWALIGRTVNAGDGQLHSSVFGLVGDASEADLLGNPGVGSDGLLVYRTTNGARAVVIRLLATGALSVVSSFTIASGTGIRSPKVSASGPTGPGACIAWIDNGSSPYRVMARALHGASLSLGFRSPELVVATAGTPLFELDIDGDGTRFVVAWAHPESTGTDRDLMAAGLSAGSNTLVANGAPIVLAGDAGLDAADPAVAWCKYRWLVGWSDEDPSTSGFDFDVKLTEITANCASCGETFTAIGAGGGSLELLPCIVSKQSGGSPTEDALVAYSEMTTSLPLPSRIAAQRYEALGGGPIAVVGTACGAPGTIAPDGPYALGNTDFGITLTGAPSGAIPFISIGVPGGEFACGTCVFHPGFVVLNVPLSGNSARFPYSLGCNYLPYVGATFSAQWWVYDAPRNNCPGATGWTCTPRLHLTLGY